MYFCKCSKAALVNLKREKNIEFGIGEVLKLLTNGVIEEVDEEKVICINFEVVIEGETRLFRFIAMPFGYRDTSRILTKVMMTPECKWRKAGVPSFIHIDFL